MSQIVTEIRKGAILIAASILAARKIAACEGRPSPAFESAIADAIATAEKILTFGLTLSADKRPPPRETRARASPCAHVYVAV